ncbi:MAG: alpha/beta hydrolase [Myxococcota bacterium]
MAAAMVLTLGTGCVSTLVSVAYGIGMPFVYREAELPSEQIELNLPYRGGVGAGDGDGHWDGDADGVTDKHRLDLFRPAGFTGSTGSTATAETGWPILVFVHGGGWTSGDRALTVGGRDVYGNIGRFFAARGVGVAVISYRLQPEVSWREQLDDVGAALRWVHAHAEGVGADPNAIFLSGHSAGAHLATYVVLDEERLETLGVPPSSLCGLILVSGAAYDLTDARTWELGASRAYYEERFRGADTSDGWMREASPIRFASPSSPPALILYAGGETKALQRQSQVLHEALVAAGGSSQMQVVPGENHERIVLTLSRADKVAARAMLDFIHTRECGRR